MQNKNYKIIKGANLLDFQAPVGYNLFQIGCIFAEYELLNLLLLYKIVYMNFRIILTQFYINLSRQEHQIDVI